MAQRPGRPPLLHLRPGGADTDGSDRMTTIPRRTMANPRVSRTRFESIERLNDEEPGGSPGRPLPIPRRWDQPIVVSR